MNGFADLSQFESLSNSGFVATNNWGERDYINEITKDRASLLTKILRAAAIASAVGGAGLYYAGGHPDSALNKVPFVPAAGRYVHEKGNDLMSKAGGFLTDASHKY